MMRDNISPIEKDISNSVKTIHKVFNDMDKDFTIWEYKREIKDLLIAGYFVKHIYRHLESHQKVICKICGRNIEQIQKEEINNV